MLSVKWASWKVRMSYQSKIILVNIINSALLIRKFPTIFSNSCANSARTIKTYAREDRLMSPAVSEVSSLFFSFLILAKCLAASVRRPLKASFSAMPFYLHKATWSTKEVCVKWRFMVRVGVSHWRIQALFLCLMWNVGILLKDQCSTLTRDTPCSQMKSFSSFCLMSFMDKGHLIDSSAWLWIINKNFIYKKKDLINSESLQMGIKVFLSYITSGERST